MAALIVAKTSRPALLYKRCTLGSNLPTTSLTTLAPNKTCKISQIVRMQSAACCPHVLLCICRHSSEPCHRRQALTAQVNDRQQQQQQQQQQHHPGGCSIPTGLVMLGDKLSVSSRTDRVTVTHTTRQGTRQAQAQLTVHTKGTNNSTGKQDW